MLWLIGIGILIGALQLADKRHKHIYASKPSNDRDNSEHDREQAERDDSLRDDSHTTAGQSDHDATQSDRADDVQPDVITMQPVDPMRYESVLADPSTMGKGDSVGNCDIADDYDFSDYDTYGAVSGWWELLADTAQSDARGKYVGPTRDGPYVGDEPYIDADTCPAGKLADGQSIWKGPDGVYVSGLNHARYNPKDWQLEHYREMLFMFALRGFCRMGDFDSAMDLQTRFIIYKSKMRGQWIMDVPQFLPGFGVYGRKATSGDGMAINLDGIKTVCKVAQGLPGPDWQWMPQIGANNGRRTYAIGRAHGWPASKVQYFYLPASRDFYPWLDSYHPGDWGKPGYFAPAPTALSQANTIAGTIVMVVNLLASTFESASSAFGLADWKKYAKLAATLIIQAAEGKKLDGGSFMPLAQELSATEAYYTAETDAEVPLAEFQEWAKHSQSDLMLYWGNAANLSIPVALR